MNKTIMDYIKQATETGQPASDYELIKRFSNEVGPSNDGLLYTYIKECHQSLSTLIGQIDGQPVIDNDIRAALHNLTEMRRKYIEQNDALNRIFGTGLSMKRIDLEEAEQAVADMVPEFNVWYEPRHQSYVLVPKLEGEK